MFVAGDGLMHVLDSGDTRDDEDVEIGNFFQCFKPAILISFFFYEFLTSDFNFYYFTFLLIDFFYPLKLNKNS